MKKSQKKTVIENISTTAEITHHTKPVKHTDTSTIKIPYIRRWPWIAIAIIIVFAAIIRIRLLQIPLQRDEGEFAYMGQLMLQGIPPYLLAYNMKLTGIYAAYAMIMAVFGQTIAGIHLGLMIVNAVAIVLLFLLARRLFDDIAGVVTAASYALLSLSPTVMGISAHATQFVVPFAVGGTLILLKAIDSGKYWMIFTGGLLYGLAFIIKQHAIFFVFFAVIYFMATIIKKQQTDWKRLAIGTGVLLMASAMPFAVNCLVLYTVGVFPRFWFWTFTYARQYVSEAPLHEGLQNFFNMASVVIPPWEWLWAMAGIGLTATFWNKKAKSNRIFLWGFLLFSFLTICPGFFFREHYFVTLLPAIALLAGVAITAAMQFLSTRNIPLPVKILPIFILSIILIFPIYHLRGFFFDATPVDACRMMYGIGPFPESMEIAEYIKNHSTGNDKIAIIGSEPQICFYANRKSATGYIYMYGLMESQNYASKMQQEMIHEIESNHPMYAVFVSEPSSWLRKANSDITLIDWANAYLRKRYRIVGIIDIFKDSYTAYWEKQLVRYQPKSRYNIYVLERL
jgi:hypothetical protein